MVTSAESDTGLTKNTQGIAEAMVIAKRSGLKEARERLRRGVNIDQKQRSWGFNLLYLSASTGDAQDVAVLLALGANPDVPNDDGETPLLRAVLNKHLDVVRKLLAAGADPSVRSKSGLSPLFVAVTDNNARMVNALLDGGADADEEQLGAGATILHAAAYGGYHAAVKALIEHGADVNVEDENGVTPLGFATGEGPSWTAFLRRKRTARLLRKLGGFA